MFKISALFIYLYCVTLTFGGPDFLLLWSCRPFLSVTLNIEAHLVIGNRYYDILNSAHKVRSPTVFFYNNSICRFEILFMSSFTSLETTIAVWDICDMETGFYADEEKMF